MYWMVCREKGTVPYRIVGPEASEQGETHPPSLTLGHIRSAA